MQQIFSTICVLAWFKGNHTMGAIYILAFVMITIVLQLLYCKFYSRFFSPSPSKLSQKVRKQKKTNLLKTKLCKEKKYKID